MRALRRVALLLLRIGSLLEVFLLLCSDLLLCYRDEYVSEEGRIGCTGQIIRMKEVRYSKK